MNNPKRIIKKGSTPIKQKNPDRLFALRKRKLQQFLDLRVGSDLTTRRSKDPISVKKEEENEEEQFEDQPKPNPIARSTNKRAKGAIKNELSDDDSYESPSESEEDQRPKRKRSKSMSGLEGTNSPTEERLSAGINAELNYVDEPPSRGGEDYLYEEVKTRRNPPPKRRTQSLYSSYAQPPYNVTTSQYHQSYAVPPQQNPQQTFLHYSPPYQYQQPYIPAPQPPPTAVANQQHDTPQQLIHKLKLRNLLLISASALLLLFLIIGTPRGRSWLGFGKERMEASFKKIGEGQQQQDYNLIIPTTDDDNNHQEQSSLLEENEDEWMIRNTMMLGYKKPEVKLASTFVVSLIKKVINELSREQEKKRPQSKKRTPPSFAEDVQNQDEL